MTKTYPKPQRAKIHWHHTVSFETIEHIEWHLENLWDGAFHCIKPMKRKDHYRLHGEKRQKGSFYKLSYKKNKFYAIRGN